LRNVECKPPFFLQTATDRFYPDFICKLEDGRILVVEYKNSKDYDLPDSKEKRRLGELLMSSLVKPHNWSFLRKQESRKIKEKTGFPLKNCGNDGNISNVLLFMNSLVWEKRSGGKCLFLMPRGKDFGEIRKKVRH